MNKVTAYDLPTRLFHFLFSILFITSFSIGKFVDDESWLYAYHMLSGMMMTVLVILRIIWGFIGTKYAKFSSFRLNPRDLIQYFKDLISGKTKRELGHNPASSYAAVAMFVFSFGLFTTGLLMVNGISKKLFEEVHELFASAFILIVLFHVAGVILHHLRNNDGLIFSMFNGKKENVEGQSGITQQAPFALLIMVILILGSGVVILKNFDSKNGRLNVFGKSLQLGENEHEEYKKEKHGKRHDHEEDEEDDDDDD